MTTEVLRNMLYAGSRTLAGLGYVVMDEVHYLADRFRGAVWEEVIIHLPESVRVVSLSATVSNAEEFGDWLDTVRGDTEVIVEEHRPVPLWQHVMVGNRLIDLFERPTTVSRRRRGQPRAGAARQDERRASATPRSAARGRQRGGAAGRGGARPPEPGRRDRRLDAAGLLPAITFIFSRAGCDAAVQQCLRAGLRLTTPEEAHEIREFAEERTADLPEEDLAVLGYWEWLDGLEQGLAAHHAGLLPSFKEVVEHLFARRPGQGRVRDRDARARHQHAGPHRRAGAAGQVERRDPRRHHAGGVHPAHRPRRAPRDRRRGPRGRAVAARARPAVGGRAGLAPAPTRCARASGRRTTWRSTWSPRSGATGPRVLETSFAQFQADRAVVGLAPQVRAQRGGAGRATRRR